jgi:membrane protease YdiL (CAAX protease family)
MARSELNSDDRPRSIPPDPLALACVLVWAAGAALGRVVGPWAGIGGAALVLGAASLCLAPGALAPLLRPSRRRVGWGLGAAALMVAATYLLYPEARRLLPWLGSSTGALYLLFRAGGSLWLTRLLLPFIILAEELVWRGVVQEALTRRLSSAASVLLCAVLYAAAHAPVGSPLLTALALLCGLFWSALRAGTGSLVPGLVSHLLWDALVFVLRPLA